MQHDRIKRRPIARYCAAALLLMAAPVWAQAPTPGRFDKPVAVRKAAAKSNGDSVEIHCTYYADFMIREALDGPSSADAALVRGTGQACNDKKAAGELVLKTSGFGYLGRKGPALFFSEMDPQGGVGFQIVDARNGRTVFKDAAVGVNDDLIQSVAMAKDGLRLSYKRAINASCSLLQNAARCWASLVTSKQIPQEMAAQIPPGGICSASYKESNAPADDPSIVIYDNEIVLSAGGQSRLLKHGPVTCSPKP